MSTVPQSTPTKDEINLALLAHLLGIFTSFVGALLLWLVKKDESAFVGENALEALNFQITVAIGYVICMMLTLVLIGALLLPLLILANVIFCVLAAVAASKGTTYRYPIALRLLK